MTPHSNKRVQVQPQHESCSCSCHESETPDITFRVKFVTDVSTPTIVVHADPNATVKNLKEKLIKLCVKNSEEKERDMHEVEVYFNARAANEDELVKHIVERHYCKRKPPAGPNAPLKREECFDFELPIVCAHRDPCRCATCTRKIEKLVCMHNKLLWKLAWDECCHARHLKNVQKQTPREEVEEHTGDDLELDELQDLFSQILEETKQYQANRKTKKYM